MLVQISDGLLLGLGASASLCAATACSAYGSMVPSSQIFGSTLVAPRRPGDLALTFDDGPNPAWTPWLLDLLSDHGVKATFFLVGKYVVNEPFLVRRIKDDGHLIGNHSWSHPNLAFISATRVREELRRTKDTLEQITGGKISYFRPPFGGRRPVVLQTARELGMTPVTWNVLTDDWQEPSDEVIAARLIKKIDAAEKRGFAGNIVLHDGGHLEPTADREPSVAAAGRVIEIYKDTHRFVRLDAWSQ
jgi:peptidoglycan-N-acetylglucosamine deacetylase